MRSAAAAAAAAVVASVLAGCAPAPIEMPRSVAESEPPEICPVQSDATAVPHAPRDCLIYDPDAAMAENERYRERRPLTEIDLVELTALIDPVTIALQPLADGSEPITSDAVVDALVATGLDRDSIQTLDGAALGFGASLGMGCIYGGVRARSVTVDVGGTILDGGCLPARGH